MISFEKAVHFGRGSRTERQLREGVEPPPGRIPRISRLMALAIHYDELLCTGVVKSLAELAELGHVSTTRISHIMNLLLLGTGHTGAIAVLKASSARSRSGVSEGFAAGCATVQLDEAASRKSPLGNDRSSVNLYSLNWD